MIWVIKKHLSIQYHQVINRKSKGGLSGTKYWKRKTTKESIKTQKFTNTSTLISQLKPSLPNQILLESKILTDVSLLSITVVSFTPEQRIQKKGIWNHQQCHLQARIQLQIKIVSELLPNKIQILPLLLAKWPTEYKLFFNDTSSSNKTWEEHDDSTDNSRTGNEDYVNNLNIKMMKITMMHTKTIIQKLLKVMIV